MYEQMLIKMCECEEIIIIKKKWIWNMQWLESYILKHVTNNDELHL